jgi:hypothetical protein
MGMTDRDYGMTSIKVEILLSLFIPYVASFSLDNVDIEQGIYII